MLKTSGKRDEKPMSSEPQSATIIALHGADPDPAATGEVGPAREAGNVVPFTPRRRDSGPELDVAERPAPYRPQADRRVGIGALLILSLLVHGALYAVFTRQPEPMASIALDTISVEIVLGAQTPAGNATTPQPTQAAETTQAANETEPEPPSVDRPEDTVRAAENPEAAEPPRPSCLYCGGSLPTNRTVNFCPHCGQSQTQILCPECRSEVEPGWRHCVNCGAAVGEA